MEGSLPGRLSAQGDGQGGPPRVSFLPFCRTLGGRVDRRGGYMESSARRDEAPMLTPRQIFERLDRYVIGQEEAKRTVAIAAHNHLKRIQVRRLRRGSLLKKSNILLMGPTGSGKTHIARNLAD